MKTSKIIIALIIVGMLASCSKKVCAAYAEQLNKPDYTVQIK